MKFCRKCCFYVNLVIHRSIEYNIQIIKNLNRICIKNRELQILLYILDINLMIWNVKVIYGCLLIYLNTFNTFSVT